jgi:hypothetical protein
MTPDKKLSKLRLGICRNCDMMVRSKMGTFQWCKSDKWVGKPELEKSDTCWLTKRAQMPFTSCPEGKWKEVDISMVEEIKSMK